MTTTSCSNPNHSNRSPTRAEAFFIRALEKPRLGLWLAALSFILSSSCLFLGFYLDDSIARYIYSDLPGAKRLYDLLSGGYGISTGSPSDNHFLIEEGWAPWWTYEHLKGALFRPVSLAAHLLDAHFFLDNAVAMRLQSLAWVSFLAFTITRMYRRSLGALVGGLAALLFAIDHTHGFEVGYICNRHTLVAATFGVLCLDQHLRFREQRKTVAAIAASLFYLLALLSSEAATSIGAYLFAYAAFAENGPLKPRVFSIAPYLVITGVWQAGYKLAGYGSFGIGLYLDPTAEPLRFFREFLERGPILLQGLFFAPPADFYELAPSKYAIAMWVSALLVTIALVAAFGPVLSRDRKARFWAVGLLLSLIPASATIPSNRQLLFASIGGMALLAQTWHLYAVKLRSVNTSGALAWSERLGAIFLFVHLVISPMILPVTTCSPAFFGQLQQAPNSVGDEIGGRDAVFVTAPEYFAVTLVQLQRRVDRRPLPRRWRALSFGAQPVTVSRKDDRTLDLTYHGGILQSILLELYRDRRIPMAVGDRVVLKGLIIEVVAVTKDRRAERARFSFDTPLDAPSFRFYAWLGGRFQPFTPPAIGRSVILPAAKVRYGLW
jgi:hypothetical protein